MEREKDGGGVGREERVSEEREEIMSMSKRREIKIWENERQKVL